MELVEGDLHTRLFVADNVRTNVGGLYWGSDGQWHPWDADHPIPNTTAGPSSEPSRTAEPQSPTHSMPGLATWQCPGCGRIYTVLTDSCACQMHRWVSSSNKIELTPVPPTTTDGATTLPKWGNFTGFVDLETGQTK
jgi:hypothetical protein